MARKDRTAQEPLGFNFSILAKNRLSDAPRRRHARNRRPRAPPALRCVASSSHFFLQISARGARGERGGRLRGAAPASCSHQSFLPARAPGLASRLRPPRALRPPRSATHPTRGWAGCDRTEAAPAGEAGGPRAPQAAGRAAWSGGRRREKHSQPRQAARKGARRAGSREGGGGRARARRRRGGARPSAARPDEAEAAPGPSPPPPRGLGAKTKLGTRRRARAGPSRVGSGRLAPSPTGRRETHPGRAGAGGRARENQREAL